MKTFEFTATFVEKTIRIPDKFYSKLKTYKNGKVIILIDDKPSNLDPSEGFYSISLQNLAKAYSIDEPDYTMSQVKEPNPKYERR